MPAFTQALKGLEFVYDIDKKEVVKIFPSAGTRNISKITKLAKNIFSKLWEIKIGVTLTFIASYLTMPLLLPTLTIPFAASLIIALGIFPFVNLIARRIFKKKEVVPPYFVADPLNISLYSLEKARAVNKVLLGIVETNWGKRWFKTSGLKIDQAFKRKYEISFKGTCAGQTLSLIGLMATHSEVESKNLLQAVKFDDIIRNQMTHSIRVELINRQPKLENNGFCLVQNELLEYQSEVCKNHVAQLEAFKSEFTFPEAEIKEKFILTDFLEKEKDFISTFKQRLEVLQKENPGKVIAARVYLRFKKGPGHTFFVQCNGGKLRYYDINPGLYEFPDQTALVSEIYKNIRGYGDVNQVGVTPFVVTKK